MGFDECALAYDQELRQGLRWSGEGPRWFAEQRVGIVRKLLVTGGATPERILEFGCGVGNHIPFFRKAFPDSTIVGVDTSSESLDIAAQNHTDPNTRFCKPEALPGAATFDLVYVNGVFHHVPAEEHTRWLRYLHQALRPEGALTIFDNNPFSLPARLVMKCIPFDRDAVMVDPYHFSKRLGECGFTRIRRQFFFIFPRILGCLRRLESPLSRLPLGAQYCLFATKD